LEIKEKKENIAELEVSKVIGIPLFLSLFDNYTEAMKICAEAMLP
jgi:hypothetical protein